eukprot:Filipodium_phascolosomae@DN8134_c0_g1_i1.p1
MKTTILEELNIRNNPIGNDGLQTLAEIVSDKKLQKLRMLECSACGIEGTAGGRALGQLVMKTAVLEELNIGYNRLGNYGTHKLAQVIPEVQFKLLKKLNCEACDVKGAEGDR